MWMARKYQNACWEKINLKHLISHEVGIDESAELIEKIFLRRVNKDSLPKFNKAIVKVSC